MSEKEVSYEQLEETEAVVRSACSVYSVVYHYSTLILGGILSAYTSAGTKCIFIKIWF